MSQNANIKQSLAPAAHLGLVKSNYFVIHKHREDGSLEKGREEGLGAERLVGEVCSLVKVLKLLSVILPLLKILCGHDDKFFVVEELLDEVIDKRFTHGRCKISLGFVRDVVPLCMVGVVIIVEVISSLVHRQRGRKSNPEQG